jgi:cytochrome c oxidase subunit I
MVTSFATFLIAGAMAIRMRVQLAVPNNDFVSLTSFNELFTVHGTIVLFLFLGPFAFGTAHYLVPIMIGAPDMAFLRFNAFSLSMGVWRTTCTPTGAALLPFSVS